MGACISEDNTIEQPDNAVSTEEEDDRPMTLMEFVRALSAPTIVPKKRMISNKSDLTPQQEEFLSKYKMTVHGMRNDSVHVSSTFNIIEDEFYDKFDRQISRDTLYKVYGIV
jgi:hypothetical protein